MSENLSTSLEISMYPLRDEFIPSIDSFLDKIHKVRGLKVQTNVMSTQVFGPFDLAFDSVQQAIKEIYQEGGQFPFVIKVLNGDVSDNSIKDYK